MPARRAHYSGVRIPDRYRLGEVNDDVFRNLIAQYVLGLGRPSYSPPK